MKRKLSKLGRSTVSVLLCLVMLLTTFCFFDIGSVISGALVSKSSHALTEAGTSSDTFAQYNISAPELVYIKQGGRDSDIFLNATSTGTVSEITSDTSALSFSCATARSVAITMTLLDVNLNTTTANRVSEVVFTDGTYFQTNETLSSASSSVNKTIKRITMATAESGKEYVIRWNIVYTTASGSYTTYAYTGIKFPLLSQAGMTTRQYYYGVSGGMVSNPAESATYSFITGVDAVKGGNVGSKWVETGSTRTAPLINFNASLYPRGLDMPINGDYFEPNGTGVLTAFAKRGTNNVYFGQGSRVYNTPWDAPGSKTYNPMDMIQHSDYFGGKPSTDGDDWGYAAADITIDTSRYSDFNEVPNLKVGFVEFDSDGANDKNYLNAIRNCSYTTWDAADYFRNNRTITNNAGKQNTAPTIYADVDRGDEKNDRSWVRGLYKLNGNINTVTSTSNLSKSTSRGTSRPIATYSGGVYTTYMKFEYTCRFSPWLKSDEYCAGVSVVKLNAKITNKGTARSYYYKYLNSGVNTSANNWSTIEGYVKSYVKTLCVSSAAAGSYTDPASAISAAQTNLKTVMKTTTPLSAPVYFYVPEAIYLAPRSSSWGAYTTSTFRYFVQNTINTSNRDASPTVKTGYDTTGYVYFSYANLSGDVTLTTRLWNSAMSSTLSGGSISSLSMSDDGQYKKATISSSSTSPSLSSTTTGYYIEWTASYKDAYDGHDKTITAYTYVYKPYVVPYGGSISAQNDRGNNTEAAQITWITGVHSINKEGDRYARYTTSNYQHGLLPFVSNSLEKINGGSYYGMNLNFSSYSERNSQAVKKYSAFANTTSAQSYFFANQTNQTWNNWDPDEWYANKNATTSVSNRSTFDKATFSYSRHSNDNGSTGNRGRSTTQTAAAEGTLYIDTSRYTNLSQIPNLGVGIMVTRDDGSKSCAWYMADYTGRTNTLGENDRQLKGENPTRVIENWNDHGTIMVRYGTPYDRKTDGEGVKYNGTWVSNVSAKSSGDKKYAVRGTYYNYEDKDTIICSVMVNMNAKLIDKTDLRAVVRRAQNNFANFGVYNNSYSSRYYQNTGAYSSFISNYKAACAALTKVDGTYDTYTDQTKINALVTALGNNIDALVKEGNTVLKRSCPVNEYNLGLEKLSNGQYKIVEIKGGKQYSMTYDARDNVYFTPDTYEGYTFAGKYELTSFTNGVEDNNVSITPSSYYGKTLASLPTFFSASNLNSNTMSISGSTATIGTTSTKTTTVPKFDGNNTTYEWVAAVNDTSLTMVNFYFIDQNKIYFDPNDGSSGVNLLTQPTTYKSGNNFYSPTFTSSPGNGVTATFDQTDSTFTFNGTPTTGAEYFRFPIAGKLKANTNYTYRVVYVSGSKTLDGGTLTLTLDICDKNGNRCYKASGENYSDRFVFDQTANQATTSRTLAPDAYQAANAEFVQVFTYSPSYGTVRYNNYKVKIELVESGSANQTYSPNAIQQFYGRSIGTMPVPVRDNYRFLGWFTAPDGGDRVTASSLMGSTDRTVYAHWALTEKTLLLDNEFDFDSFVSKASNNNSFNILMSSYKACKGQAMTNPLSDQTKPYTYSIAKDVEGDTALNIKYDRNHIGDAGVGEVFDTFKSNTYTASVKGEYTLSYEYRINDYYSQFSEEHGNTNYDSVVLGFSTNDGYWYNGGQGVSYTENRKTTNGYESVELRRSFAAGTQYFFNMVFYFCNEDGANRFRADMDIKNVVLKDPDGNIVLSSNGMNTVNGTSSFDSDARTITLKPTAGDCYTDTYNSSQLTMKLDPGNYTFMYDYQATTNTRLLPYIFTFASETSNAYMANSAGINVSAGSGTMAVQFTVRSDRPWIRVRFGVDKYNGGSTVSGPVTVGNISIQRTEIFSDGTYVADSSTYLGWVSKVTGSTSATAVYVNDLNSRNEKLTAHYQDLEHGSQITDVYVPTREGFTFLGWWNAAGTRITDANGNAVGNAAITATTKLYSRWTPKTFNLKYNAFRPNDSAGEVTSGTVGNLPTPNPQELKFGVKSSISPTAPTLTGYTFSGWSKTSGGTKAYDKGQALSASTVSQMYKDCNGGTYNIYTTWTANKYKIHFDKNATEAKGSMADMDMVYDVAKNLSENKFSREGYTFQGWNTAKNGSGTSYDDKALVNNLTAAPNGTVTLYAKWTPNTNTVYKVNVYVMNTSGGYPTTPTTHSYTGTTDTSVTIDESIYYPDKSGQFWLDINKSNVLTGTIKGDGSLVLVVYIERASHTVTYNGNGGTPVTQTRNVYYQGAVDFTLKAEKKDWTFVGWNKSSSATEKLSSLTMGTTDITLYAIFNCVPKATFYYFNGSTRKSVQVNAEKAVYADSEAVSFKIPDAAAAACNVNGLSWTSKGFSTSETYNENGTSSGAMTFKGTLSGVNVVRYYMSYSATVKIEHNANGGTLTGTNPKGTSTLNASSASTQSEVSLKTQTPAVRDGYVFKGWDTNSSATNPAYSAEQSVSLKTNLTLYAIWFDAREAETKAKQLNKYVQEKIPVVKGVTVKKDGTYSELDDGTIVTIYKADEYEAYKNAVNAYTKAKAEFTKNKTSANNSALLEAAKMLAEKIKYPTQNNLVNKYFNNFTVEYESGITNQPVKPGKYSLSKMNLNHYSATVLDDAFDAKASGEKCTSIFDQKSLNAAVKKMAEAFAKADTVKTAKPGFKVYESVDSVNKSEDASLKALAGATASNYVHTKKGATYYCYVNTTNPVILVTIEDGIGGGRVCYPTTATALKNADGKEVTLSGSAKSGVETYSTDTITAKNFDKSYSKYTNVGIGGDINRYKQKQVIKLTPEFAGNADGTVTYEFAATDDALKANVANQAKLSSDTNYSSTARYSLIDPKKPDSVDNRKYTTNENTIKIVVDYHVAKEIKDKNGNPTGEFQKLDVTGDQVQIDKYLNQYHLFRQSGGASNWELPKTGDQVYKVNDTTYGQTDRGSFTFTYELGATDIGNGKINTTDVNEIIKLFKDESNYSAAKKLSFVGAKYWTKESNGTIVQNKGSGLGYQVWGNNWSFNYYPKSESYTYVHLVDRWGNVVDKVFYVGKQDIKEVSVSTASADGAYTILEDGGSGIDTLSLNAGTLEILTDENSTLENNVYRTTGNTVRIKTGEANKSYTLSMKDKATNASTATLKSDGNGIITLSVEDTAYKSGVYTFMLNGTEINLYDGVNKDKYIVNVYDGEAEEGEAAEMIVITTGEVGKTRFTDTDGNTITVAASETNEDGTKTWRMSKSRPAGEYEYRISVKVGHNWIEENSTGKLIFTEKQLDTGRIVKAEYDEESGLYKLTIEGRATKIQFITEDGMTRTYTRYSEAVKSRKSYDTEGNEVPDTGRLLDHEVWLVNARLYSGQNYTVAGKFEAGWNREGTATLTAH